MPRSESGARRPLLFFASTTDEAERTEVYGESESRAVFSAEFSGAPERAFALSRAELRMSPYRAASAALRSTSLLH